MIKAHANQRYCTSLEHLPLCRRSIHKLESIAREKLESGFLKYVELAQCPPNIMKISSIYGANTFLNEQADHDMAFWKLKIGLISTKSLIGLLIGDVLASGYMEHEINLVLQKEILPLFE